MFTLALTAALALPLASAAIIDVFVGGTDASGALQLVYTPPSVTANVGDSVRLTFGFKNHSIAQSSFAEPCSPLAGGFFSGFMPVAEGQTEDLPQFWIPVKDTKPIWGYCTQTGHCGKGMVFAINAPAAPAANSFDNFLAAAESTGASAATTAATAGPTTAAANAENDYGYGTDPTSTTAAVDAASTATTASGTVHTVVVGGSAGLVFTPSQVTAQVGDTVLYQFLSKNHTVTQSTFADPCSALAGGFDSGFMPNADSTTPAPTYTYTVKDNSPVWAFCRQTGHCAQGMVFALNVNASSPNSFAAFQNNAKGATAAAANASPSPSSSSSSSYGNGASSTLGSNTKLSLASLAMVSLGFAVLF